jgi:integrase
VLPTRRAKNRKATRQPVPAGVAAELRPWLASKPAGRQLWPGSWWRKAAEMLRLDLDTAGVPYKLAGPDGPLFSDFHSFRHTYVTHLAAAGVHPKHAQELARHSDIRLTMERYTHAEADALTESVNRLALPAADVDPIAALPRPQLEALAVKLLALVGVLVALPVAPPNEPDGDGPGRLRTKAADRKPRPNGRKPLESRQMGFAWTDGN